jgi:hypothetical protein
MSDRKLKWKYRFASGLPAKLWGASAWTWKHAVTWQNRTSFENEALYYSLTQNNLPCPTCTKSFKKFLSSHPYQSEEKRQPRPLSYLFHITHNYVNEKNGQPTLTYRKNQEVYQFMSSQIWLLALIDYLVALSVYQIDRSTTLVSKHSKKVKKMSDIPLPIYQLLSFILLTDFLRSVPDSTVKRFVDVATTGDTSLLDPSLFDLEGLKKNSTLTYLAQPFILRLEKVRNLVFPGSSGIKLENRAHIFLTAKGG